MTDAVREGMALDEFIAAMDAQPFELIRGKRTEKLPELAGESFIRHRVYLLIGPDFDDGKRGIVFMRLVYVVPNLNRPGWVEKSRIADVAYFDASRVEAYKAADPDWGDKPMMLVPDLAVEVIAPDDKYSEVGIKVDAYRADGVRLVWIVDPQQEKVIVHHGDDWQPQVLAGDVTLSGADVLPGFTVQVSEIFTV